MTIRRCFKVTLALTTLAVWSVFFRPGFLGGPAGYIIVSGMSMEPTFYTGDLVVTQKQDDYETGDVVAFRADGSVIIHRIVGGSAAEGFQMLGDNKESLDDWRPTLDHIIGKKWMHLPGGGDWLALLRKPLGLGLLMGGLMTSTFVGKRKTLLGRQRTRRMSRGKPQQVGSPAPISVGKSVLLGIASAAILCLLAITVYAARQPLTSTYFDERLSYEHSADFSYTAHTDRSTLYPDGIVGPVSSEAPEAALPLYTKLLHDLDLDISYFLQSDRVPVLEGEMSILVTVSADDGWSQVVSESEPIPFTGHLVQGNVSIDIQQIQSIIETIQEETGYRASSYNVSVMPTISVNGQIGSEPVDDVYMPSYVFGLTTATVTPPAELSQSEVESVGEEVVRQETISLLGITTTVETARLIGVVGLPIALAVVGLLAAMTFLGLGGSETEKIRARYRSMLIEVNDAELNWQHSTVDVASIQDLARFAQRDGRVIFHHLVDPSTRRYFVADGTSIYQYRVQSPAGRV